MTVLTAPAPSQASAASAVVARRSVNIQDRIFIPGWICDQESYRQWARSDEYPQSGWVAFLDGDIYVDPDMEEILTHNQVKQAFNLAVGHLTRLLRSGRYFPDRMLYSNEAANLTTESDGLYACWETLTSGRLRFVPAKDEGYVEAEGSADMALEIISKSSVKKDSVRLRDLYWRAGVGEYWLVDARSEVPKFSILRRGAEGYLDAPSHDGWVVSEVFKHRFRLVREIDRMGHPEFTVEVQPFEGNQS